MFCQRLVCTARAFPWGRWRIQFGETKAQALVRECKGGLYGRKSIVIAKDQGLKVYQRNLDSTKSKWVYTEIVLQ